METLYFLTSGIHKTLPIEELEALHEIYGCPLSTLSIHNNIVLAKGNALCSAKVSERAAFIKEVGEVCALADEDYIVYIKECEFDKVIKKRLSGAREFSIRLVPKGKGTIKIMYVEGFAVVGRPISKRKHGKSHKGPFFSPGSMDPLLARAMVNISRIRSGERFLDPFCGTGTFAIEASRMGTIAYCSDIDPSMVHGSKINSEHVGSQVECIWSDSLSLPFKSNSIDAIASDPPYGRSVVAWGPSPERLLEGFLEEASRVLKRGSWLVLASSENLWLRKKLEDFGFVVHKCHVMRVHRSLTRVICSAKML